MQVLRHMAGLALPLLLLLPAAGCAAPPPRPTEPAPVAPAGVEITFELSGGVGGQYALWTIRGDGQITRDNGESYTIPPERVAQLLDEITDAGFFDLRAVYKEVECADCFFYIIAVNDGRRAHRVSMLDSGQLPASAKQIVMLLRDFVSALASAPSQPSRGATI
jgi:hypothetical protein